MRLVPGAVKDTILVEVQTNRVSIPSVLEVGAGDGALLAMRAGSVKERRTGAFETAGGACAGLDVGVWEAMPTESGWHFPPSRVETEGRASVGAECG